jgi:subtilisin family serine protease
VGLSGVGVTVAVADTGVDANAGNNAIGHTDLRGRQVALVAYPNGQATDTDGHGTHVAGIAVGSGATGQTEAAAPGDFLWGQGVAPAAGYVTQAFLLTSPQPSTATLIADAATNGADVVAADHRGPAGRAGPGRAGAGGGRDRVMAAPFTGTAEAGSYNVAVTASGIDPASGARFTRQELVAVLVS